MSNKAFQTKSIKIPGTKYSEVQKKALRLYATIKKLSKRRPYIRSAYFKKDKIFLGLFWHHIKDKHHRDRTRRLKYFPCGLELIRHCHLNPTSIESPDDQSIIFHRFTGITSENDVFFVQIKENKRNGQKFLISVFPLGSG